MCIRDRLWLVLPSFLGIGVLVLDNMYEYNISNSPFHFLYANFVLMCSILFLKFWRRHQNCKAATWHSFKESISEVPNPNFTGELRISPVTNLPEKHMSTLKRILRYLLTYLITVLYMGFGTYASVILMNMKGIITTKPEEDWLFMETFHAMSVPGAIFDINTCLLYTSPSPRDQA
eukprot:TRINITY_DN9934_c0_g1_i1.p1 TRINITY_DN9934_c0_g1~~TRINITY_DN9934_c0_g1_i1.p1  ORF type:complete len:176 (+),score=38.58 TRINITY_DN9934_c0_g1_i1:64-591(+)